MKPRVQSVCLSVFVVGSPCPGEASKRDGERERESEGIEGCITYCEGGGREATHILCCAWLVGL